MTKTEEVAYIFKLMNKLRELPRKGWHDKGIKRSRVESVADHIYGCQMLAYAMHSEFEYDVDVNRTILLLAVHEIGEIIMGDYTPEDMPREEKLHREGESAREVLESISNNELFQELYNEYDEQKTKEAIFAFQVDHAECDLQARLYEQDGSYEETYNKYEFTKSWVEYDLNRPLKWDPNFIELLNYIINNQMEVKEHSDNRIQNVISFYTATNTLKDVPAKAASKDGHYESEAEHIYSVQMLALAMYVVFGEDVDITRVINLISVYRLNQINGVTNDEDDTATAVAKLLSNNQGMLALLSEYNESKTKESRCAKARVISTPSYLNGMGKAS